MCSRDVGTLFGKMSVQQFHRVNRENERGGREREREGEREEERERKRDGLKGNHQMLTAAVTIWRSVGKSAINTVRLLRKRSIRVWVGGWVCVQMYTA